MNRKYNSRVSSRNSERLIKNLKNTTGDYFFAAACRQRYFQMSGLLHANSFIAHVAADLVRLRQEYKVAEAVSKNA